MTQITFQRCPHDKINPYVMLSREMLQDRSISPKAKGILAYLLSLPPDWKIYHCQLQEALGVGEDYLNSAFEELINAGYAERTRERINGLFQPYKYIIREFKKCLPDGKNPAGLPTEENLQKTHPQCSLNQTGLAGPENPAIQSKEDTNKIKQQQPAAAAAVFFECLKSIDIPIFEKIYLTSHYAEDSIKHAIAYCFHPKTKIETTLIQALKWACKSQPSLPRDPEAEKKQQQIQDAEIDKIIYERKKGCEKLSIVHHKHMKENRISFTDKEYITINTFVEYVEIGNDKIYYKDNKFNELIRHLIRKYNIFTGNQMKAA